MSNSAESLRNQFINGMSKLTSTVTVVTTDGPAGQAGVTVSAMTSVSADGDTPTLLVCIHHLSPAARAIQENGCFCTNILSQGQHHVANTFAGLEGEADKFTCADWIAGQSGSAHLQNALVNFDCKVISSEQVGTHHVFIGAVKQVTTNEAETPLLYGNRNYRQSIPLDN